MSNEWVNLTRAQAVMGINLIQFSKCLRNFYYLSRAAMGAEETNIEYNPYIQIIYNLKKLWM